MAHHCKYLLFLVYAVFIAQKAYVVPFLSVQLTLSSLEDKEILASPGEPRKHGTRVQTLPLNSFPSASLFPDCPTVLELYNITKSIKPERKSQITPSV
ncbi:MAG: hypothetical protein BRC33_11235 [Cyanobacteria bacterium SW_9_44_58]|nr:MAG: hypothetical protein BRC33_11235 [Cyanobacteria bacterium SW_9_44_58]